MIEQPSNDNSTAANARPRGPDAHGQAAMLLVESLIHGLIAKSIVSVAEAVEIVSVAAEVKVEVAAELREPHATMERSLTILRAVSESLSSDMLDGTGDGPPGT